MRRHGALLIGGLGVVLVVCFGIAAIGGPAGHSRVYTAAEVRDRLDRDPSAWVGRTVVVRAIAEPCPWWGTLARRLLCADAHLVLAGTPAEPPAAPQPLVPRAPHPLLAFLRGLPLLGDLLPRPRIVPLLVAGPFRVRLLSLPIGACARRLPCYEALLLDAAPDSP